MQGRAVTRRRDRIGNQAVPTLSIWYAMRELGDGPGMCIGEEDHRATNG
jgi:hypothetical protein